MYQHAKLRAFENQLKALFNEVDHQLEDRWGNLYSVHPNRPRRGETADPEMDGLFEVAPDFTPGIGSEMGRGYIINLRVATLDRLDSGQYEALMQEAADMVKRLLPRYFPERDLRVVRDGKRFKIIGDFSLGFA
ncbi:hypothetical protein [Gracilinema caldarium]|uniref:Uncharacterized protein n=1 Tax=Gracilinema caldarium (strain ATCC 51460 / DSM 7334 / H1) TaxID=744872 RepID=F8F456_GRAC1|nr:hypothetical protein [Gracilinema caldarium]AEJ20075.1 hypothetical protein Spica_1946 [Gracilinema caldarium DSM 7334]